MQEEETGGEGKWRGSEQESKVAGMGAGNLNCEAVMQSWQDNECSLSPADDAYKYKYKYKHKYKWKKKHKLKYKYKTVLAA